jgi:hypothetical protein
MDLNKNMVRNCPSCGSDNVEMYMPYPSVCDFHIRCKECNVTGQAGIVEQDGLLKWKILPRGEVIVQQKFCDQIEKLLKEELEVSGFPENVIESMKKESSAVISSFSKHLLEHCSEVDILPYCKKINSTILNYLACNYYDRREDERGTERIR